MARVRRWSLIRRPQVAIGAADFAIDHVDVDETPGPGEVLFATRYISLDPYLLLGMRTGPPGPCLGRVIGEVLASDDPKLPVGSLVWGVAGWQELNIVPGAELTPIPNDGLPPTTALGALGRSGLTAWVGLHLSGLKTGETLLVSAATGPVGSVAGQIARLRGARAIGIAGGADKCRLATERFGFEACLDHREPDLAERIAAAAPGGVHVLFENVGAPTLDPALPAMVDRGRIMLCGLVAHYDDAAAVSLRNFRLLLLRHLTVRGFATTDHPQLFARGESELREWAKAGRLAWFETITDGFEETPAALVAMLKGGGTGKRLVRL